MTDVDELIRVARPGGQEATPAVRRLINIGAPILGRAITAFEREPMNSPGLAEVISRNDSPEAVSILLNAMNSGSIALSRNAMQALASSQNTHALDCLVEFLVDEDQFEVRRSLAASALGEATSADVRATLRGVIDQQVEVTADDDDVRFLLVAAIVALAKHGEHSRAWLLLELASTPFSATQELAIRGLEVAIADGMIESLTIASRSPAPSVAQRAAKSLFLLGNAAGAEVLHSMAKSDDIDIQHNARIYLARILGLDLTERDELNQLELAWSRVKSSMDESVCYRSGHPNQVSGLVNELIHSEGERTKGELADEIQNRTGVDAPRALLMGLENDLTEKINGMQLTAGVLYRWGYRKDMPTG